MAAGISDNLVTRSAIVAMKERRKLILAVPREAPYATVHLENMTKIIVVGINNHPCVARFLQSPEVN